MSRRYFAVGAAKGWVQIRSATKPPVSETTETTTTITERRGYSTWDAEAERYHYSVETVPKKLTLRVTTFTGGRTLWTVPASRFARLLKVGVREGGMVELMPEQIAAIKRLEAKRGRSE